VGFLLNKLLFSEKLYLPVHYIFPLKKLFMKQLLTTFAIFSISSVLFVACNNTADESGTNTTTEKEIKSFDLTAVRKSIDSVNAQFGAYVAKGDSSGIASLYHSDAKMLGQSMPIVAGRSAIQNAFGEMLRMGIAGATLTSNEVFGTADLVSEVGTYSLKDKSGKEIDKGKYIVLWKMEDGQWKLFRDCFNSDNPPPPSH
jgi:ketosteroid isomerase-like protein